LADQLFLIILDDKFVFFVVNSERREENEKDSLTELSKKILKKILNLSNHFILESNNKEIGYFGTIAFEVKYDELYGMEFTNSLLQDSWRIVTEWRSLRKKSFNNVVDMLEYYRIEFTWQEDITPPLNKYNVIEEFER
jgi:hypothetical protein